MDQKYKVEYKKGKFKTKRNINVRHGAPSTKVPYHEITLGTIVEYAGWVENGELFSGISKWFFDTKEENFFWAGNCEDIMSAPTNIQIDPQVEAVEIIKNDDEKHPLKLVHKQYYGATSPETITIRDYINDEFHNKISAYDLQCTEYAYYRLKCSGIEVEWNRNTNRHGGLWPEAVATKYKVVNTPVVGGVMCIPLSVIPGTGHIAYVEKINLDKSIEISEANWGTKKDDLGHYWERNLPLSKWKDYYKATFIDFKI